MQAAAGSGKGWMGPKVLRSAAVMVLSLFVFSFAGLDRTIHEEAAAGDVAALKSMIARDPDLLDSRDDKDRTPLHFACHEGRLEAAEFLISAGADVNARMGETWTPLHSAVKQGRYDLVKLLLRHGAFN